MRSATPKVLHEICGRPMGLWPVVAALEAGAGKVVVVDSPARPLAEVLPAGVELVVQPVSNGTGGAVAAAAQAIDPGAPVVVLSGDVPLVSAAAIARAGGGPRRGRGGSDDGDHRAGRPDRLWPRGARRARRGGARGGDQEGWRRHRGGARDPRGQYRHLRVRWRGPAGGAAAAERRQRPGRAVPAAGARPAARRRRGGARPRRRRPAPRARRQ